MTSGLSDDPQAPLTRSEILGLAVCAAFYLLLRFWGLRHAVINDKFDEGVYLSLMQSVAMGKGELYRDLILCHPPGVMWVGAWLWPRVGGSLFALRGIYIAVCALGYAPMYALARKLYGPRVALVTLALLTTSPGFANWLGREIFLDPLLNVPLYTALWALVCVRPARTGVALGAGALLGVSYLIKETALPAALMVCAALWLTVVLGRKGDRDVQEPDLDRWAWLWTGIGFVAAFGVTLAFLMRLPNYGYYTFTLNAHDHFRWDLRLHEYNTGLYALPLPLTFGLLGVARMAFRPERRAERFLGLFAVLMTLLMVCVPKLFYWRYLLPAAPLYCLGVALWGQRFFASRPSPRARRVVMTLGGLLLLVHLACVLLYHTHESRTPPAYDIALAVLKRSPGPLFTLNPIWAAGSGQPLIPKVQRLIKATIHVPVTSEEYTSVLADCPTVLLEEESQRWMANDSLSILRTHFRTVFVSRKPGEHQYVEILRRVEPGETANRQP